MSTRDLSGKTIAITGANSGIGFATAQALGNRGATLLLCARSQEKIKAAAAAIKSATGNDQIHTFVADLSVMAEVRALAVALQEQTPRLDVLINNAGIASDRRTETVDGLELTFAVNYLAPFVLTNELLPLLKASAPSRIVNVSSALYRNIKKLDLDDLQSKAGRFSWQAAYNQSKLASVLFTRSLSKRLEGQGVTANVLHPGVVKSEFGADGDLGGINALSFKVMKWFLPGPEKGAETSVYLASSPTVENVSGRYFEKCKEKAMSALALDDDLAESLWKKTEDLARALQQGM